MEQPKIIDGFFQNFFERYLYIKNRVKAKTAFIAILHTFGKDLKFHPHLHLIALNGYFDTKFNPYNISFNHKFDKVWRAIVIKSLNIYNFTKYRYGFFVWSNPEYLKQKEISKYTVRYVRHPAISNSKILKYENNEVIFSYVSTRNERVIIKKPVDNFITSLIQHIPKEHFKLIRHYGVYARNPRYRDIMNKNL
ncbi:MAG: transposase [Nanoarchaeota archaeon]|nr:transposase [Nanoarchaeota archaeon]